MSAKERPADRERNLYGGKLLANIPSSCSFFCFHTFQKHQRFHTSPVQADRHATIYGDTRISLMGPDFFRMHDVWQGQVHLHSQGPLDYYRMGNGC